MTTNSLTLYAIYQPINKLFKSYNDVMDAKKTIEKLKGETDRQRVSLYLSQSIFTDFKKICGEISTSRVIEELMKEFLESNKSDKKPTKKNSKK